MVQRILSSLLVLLFMALTFVLFSFLVALALSAGLIAWGWLWWRSRGRRGRVLEGQYRIIEIR